MITPKEKLEVAHKALTIMLLLQANGIGRNKTTAIALRLLAKFNDYEPGTVPLNVIHEEIEFLNTELERQT